MPTHTVFHTLFLSFRQLMLCLLSFIQKSIEIISFFHSGTVNLISGSGSSSFFDKEALLRYLLQCTFFKCSVIPAVQICTESLDVGEIILDCISITFVNDNNLIPKYVLIAY